MNDRASKRRLPHPLGLLLGYGLGAALTSVAIWEFDLPQAALTLWAIPIPLLPLAYPRWVHLSGIVVLISTALLLATTIAPGTSEPFLRVPIQGCTILGMAELVRFVAGQRERAMQALRESEERYRLLLETPDVVPFEVELSCGRFTYIGPQAERLLGYAQRTWYTEGFWEEHIHPEDREAAVRFCQEATERRKDHEFEYRMLAADGSVHWLRDIVSVVFGSNGEPVGLRGVLVDISEQRRAEEALRASEERTRQAQKLESLGLLAGGIAHDFNNLLVGILGNTSLALEQLPSESTIREQLEDVELSAERAAELTHQLLAYAGKAPVETGIHELSALVRESGHLLEAAIVKTTSFEFEVLPDGVWVNGNSAQLRQLVMNLIVNASEALGGQAGTIRLRTGVNDGGPDSAEVGVIHGDSPPQPCAFVEVTDTGAGMDAATLEKMFDPFFTTKSSGHGLGLAAVLGIVRSHAGALRVTSTPQQGTSIRVLLPQACAPEATEGLRTPNREPFEGGTVLVADDEELVRRVIVAGLERAGFRVLTAADGVEAVDVFRAHAADLCAAVLDMSMPRASGSEVLVEIRKTLATLPVLLTSGYAEERFEELEGANDSTRFLQKPFRAADLLDALRGALEATSGP